MSSWHEVDLREFTRIESALSRIPEQGNFIYTFSHNLLPLPTITNGPALLQHVREVCEHSYFADRVARLPPYHEVVLKSLKDTKGSYLRGAEREDCFLDENFCSSLREALSAIQLRVPPLYVGETKALQNRFRDHLSGSNSPLSERLKHYGIDIFQTRFSYIQLELEFPGDKTELDHLNTQPSVVTDPFNPWAEETDGLQSLKNADQPLERKIVEEVLSRLCFPGFINKLGSQTFD